MPGPGRRSRFRGLLGAAGVVLVAVVATASCWPPRSVGPQPDLDSSWKYLLTAAYGQHLRFGRDLVFTYGPLGWLFSPVAASWPQLVAATAVTAVTLVAGFTALRWLFRRVLPPLVSDAAVLAVAAVVATGTPELLATMAVLVVLARLADGPRGIGWLAVAVAGGVGGAALTTKFGVGELLVAVGVPFAAASALPLPRAGAGRIRGTGRIAARVAVWAAAVAGGFAAAWYGTGQQSADLVSFVRGSAEIQRGYQTAMVFDAPGRAWEAVGDGAGFLLLLVWCVALVVRARGRRVRAGALALAGVGGVSYELLQAYVRHDAVHDVAGQAMAVLLALALLAGGRGLTGRRAAAATTTATTTTAAAHGGTAGGRVGGLLHGGLAVVCALGFLGTFVASSPGTLETLQPPSRIRAVVRDAHRVADPARQDRAVGQAWVRLRRTDPYPAAIVSALTGRRMVPVPYDIAGPVAWGMRPVTVPVPQTYSAYTAYLDRLNTAALFRPDAPPVLRRTAFSQGGPNPMWESPLFLTTLVCHYRQRLAVGFYQILAPGPQVCSVSRTVLRSLDVHAGQVVTVPRPAHPGDGVTMSITAHPSRLVRLVTAAVRLPHAWAVRVDGRLVFRLAPRGLGEPMVVVMPPGLWSRGTYTGGDDDTLRFIGVPRLTVTFSELVRTAA